MVQDMYQKKYVRYTHKCSPLILVNLLIGYLLRDFVSKNMSQDDLIMLNVIEFRGGWSGHPDTIFSLFGDDLLNAIT